MSRVLRCTGSVALGAIAALWAVGALGTSRGPWTFDGYCYREAPAWVVTQAVLAVAGVALLLWLIVVLVRVRRPLRAAFVTWGLAGAAVIFAAWSFVTIDLVMTGERVLCEGQSPLSI